MKNEITSGGFLLETTADLGSGNGFLSLTRLFKDDNLKSVGKFNFQTRWSFEEFSSVEKNFSNGGKFSENWEIFNEQKFVGAESGKIIRERISY